MEQNSSKENLTKAIQLIKEGKKKEGGQILFEIVKSEPKNENAWLWLSMCLADKNKKIQCLNKVLEINPGNDIAKKALEKLFQETISKPSVDEIINESKSNINLLTKKVIIILSILVILLISFIVIYSQIISPKKFKSIALSSTETSIASLSTRKNILPSLIPTESSIPTQTITIMENTLTPYPTPTVLIQENNIEGIAKDYIVALSDLQGTYLIDKTMTGELSNYYVASFSENPNEKLQELENFGRISGYHANYGSNKENPLWVYTNVVIVNSSQNAHNYFNSTYEDLLETWLPVDIPLLGDESNGLFKRGDSYDKFRIGVRIRNILSYVEISGYGEEILEDCINYAKISEQRLLNNIPKATIDEEPNQEEKWIFKNDSKQIGPILSSNSGESYSLEITVQDILFTKLSKYDESAQGKVFVLINISISNLGPNSAQSVSKYDFEFRDENGAIQRGYFVFFDNCEFVTSTLSPGGSINGCLGFEIPDSGNVDLIYAPYQNDPFGEGRYLAFTLRE